MKKKSNRKNEFHCNGKTDGIRKNKMQCKDFTVYTIFLFGYKRQNVWSMKHCKQKSTNRHIYHKHKQHDSYQQCAFRA